MLLLLSLTAKLTIASPSNEQDIFKQIDSTTSPLSQRKNYNINGASVGITYSRHLKTESPYVGYIGIHNISTHLFQLGFKWRESLFEIKFGLGFGNIKETRQEDIYFRTYGPNWYTYEQKLNEVLYQLNLQLRIFTSNRTRLTPFFYTGLNILPYKDSEYSTIISIPLGFGLQYFITNYFSLEGSFAVSYWYEKLNSYTEANSTFPMYFEFGIYKKIVSRK